MRAPSFNPTASKERGAAIRMGATLLGAEQAMPDGGDIQRVSLAWVCSTAAAGTGRIRAMVEGVQDEQRNLGSWMMTARTIPAPPEAINLARRAFLEKEGAEILALASPFAERNEDPAQAVVTFSLLALASEVYPARSARWVVDDRHGARTTVRLRRIGAVEAFVRNRATKACATVRNLCLSFGRPERRRA
jgi:hypothetical protein